jgi:hypothetical protein
MLVLACLPLHCCSYYFVFGIVFGTVCFFLLSFIVVCYFPPEVLHILLCLSSATGFFLSELLLSPLYDVFLAVFSLSS